MAHGSCSVETPLHHIVSEKHFPWHSLQERGFCRKKIAGAHLSPPSMPLIYNAICFALFMCECNSFFPPQRDNLLVIKPLNDIKSFVKEPQLLHNQFAISHHCWGDQRICLLPDCRVGVWVINGYRHNVTTSCANCISWHAQVPWSYGALLLLPATAVLEKERQQHRGEMFLFNFTYRHYVIATLIVTNAFNTCFVDLYLLIICGPSAVYIKHHNLFSFFSPLILDQYAEKDNC